MHAGTLDVYPDLQLATFPRSKLSCADPSTVHDTKRMHAKAKETESASTKQSQIDAIADVTDTKV